MLAFDLKTDKIVWDFRGDGKAENDGTWLANRLL